MEIFDTPPTRSTNVSMFIAFLQLNEEARLMKLKEKTLRLASDSSYHPSYLKPKMCGNYGSYFQGMALFTEYFEILFIMLGTEATENFSARNGVP